MSDNRDGKGFSYTGIFLFVVGALVTAGAGSVYLLGGLALEGSGAIRREAMPWLIGGVVVLLFGLALIAVGRRK